MTRRSNVISIASAATCVKVPHVTIIELRELYLQHTIRKGLSPYTTKHERENLNAGIKIIGADTEVSELTTEKLETTLFDEWRRRGLNPNTITGRRKTWHRFLDYAVEIELATANPVDQVEKMRKRDIVIYSLTFKQLDDLRKQPDLSKFTGLRDRTMIDLLADTGIRLRELLSLQVSQVDLRGRRLREVLGKNGKVEDIHYSDPMRRLLQQYLSARGNLATSELFVSIDGRPLSRRTFQQRLKRYGSEAGIHDVRVSPHTLRHTFAKHWILNGGDPYTLQKILRHSSMDMVQKYYRLWAHELQAQQEKYSPLVLSEARGEFKDSKRFLNKSSNF